MRPVSRCLKTDHRPTPSQPESPQRLSPHACDCPLRLTQEAERTGPVLAQNGPSHHLSVTAVVHTNHYQAIFLAIFSTLLLLFRPGTRSSIKLTDMCRVTPPDARGVRPSPKCVLAAWSLLRCQSHNVLISPLIKWVFTSTVTIVYLLSQHKLRAQRSPTQLWQTSGDKIAKSICYTLWQLKFKR